jgi:hypothetical protein
VAHSLRYGSEDEPHLFVQPGTLTAAAAGRFNPAWDTRCGDHYHIHCGLQMKFRSKWL